MLGEAARQLGALRQTHNALAVAVRESGLMFDPVQRCIAIRDFDRWARLKP